MNEQMFQIGEIAITQGMEPAELNGIEVQIIGPMHWSSGFGWNFATGKWEEAVPAWRYLVAWPGDPRPRLVRYWRLRKKRPPSEEIPEMEGSEAEV